MSDVSPAAPELAQAFAVFELLSDEDRLIWKPIDPFALVAGPFKTESKAETALALRNRTAYLAPVTFAATRTPQGWVQDGAALKTNWLLRSGMGRTGQRGR